MNILPAALWNVGDWADAIVALPASGVLPCRTALVPHERVAHSLRRELARKQRLSALAGTRFVSIAVAAIAALRATGADFAPGEEALRPVRLRRLFEDPPPLAHFSARLLRDKPGWDEAFASTITELEAAGLSPEMLPATDSASLADVARVWRSLNRLAARSWTIERIYVEAAAALARSPDVWPYQGPVLLSATGHEGAALARFLRAIPGASLGMRAARPLRARHLDRVEALFGREARQALTRSAPRSSATERHLLASYLFEPPAVLADPARPRSSGPDDTVRLEEHAGLESEIEAAADWVAEQISSGVALEEIAILLPSIDPVGALVAERLARSPWPTGTLPVHVAGGLPLSRTAAGARSLAVVRALRAHLAGAALADVLPALRTASEDGRHLSHGAATDLVWSLGTAGGSPARPRGALEWVTRLAAREPQLEVQLARAREAADDDPERSRLARTARDLERLLGDLRAARPAVEALVGVSRLVLADAPLGEVWRLLRAFLVDWLLQPGDGPRVERLLDEPVATAAADETCGALRGDGALRFVEDAITSTRLPVGHFGEPAVYIGTVASALGLQFVAVRVIGLAEGHLPPLVREDPVVPDALRATLTVPGHGDRRVAPASAGDRALEALHALDIAVRAAERSVALSAPRLDLDRSQRERSSVILEAAAALARPNAVTGERGAVIPDTAALQRDGFAPARRAALRFRARMPLAETAWQDAVAAGALGVPGRWAGDRAHDLARIAALSDDGVLGVSVAHIALPGLAPDWPISPSVLKDLLQCPYLFLLGRLLRFEEPASAPSLREIGQPAYGSLFHLVAEEVFRAHGSRLCAREGTLAGWLAVADPIIDRLFDEFLEQYPLVGVAVRGAQRQRLRDDVHDLLRHIWGIGRQRFVAAERVFGEPAPIPLSVGERTIFLRGKIDQIVAEDGLTIVRDLKTGRVHPRVGEDAEPDPVGDVQVGVYGLVAQELARDWGTPLRVGVAYVGSGGQQRSFADDFATVLAPAAREWLAIASDLLAERSFPRTAARNDCGYCRFRPVCGEDAHERAAMILADGDTTLRRFLALKRGDGDDD